VVLKLGGEVLSLHATGPKRGLRKLRELIQHLDLPTLRRFATGAKTSRGARRPLRIELIPGEDMMRRIAQDHWLLKWFARWTPTALDDVETNLSGKYMAATQSVFACVDHIEEALLHELCHAALHYDTERAAGERSLLIHELQEPLNEHWHAHRRRAGLDDDTLATLMETMERAEHGRVELSEQEDWPALAALTVARRAFVSDYALTGPAEQDDPGDAAEEYLVECWANTLTSGTQRRRLKSVDPVMHAVVARLVALREQEAPARRVIEELIEVLRSPAVS
jgi:hypothetical protein